MSQSEFEAITCNQRKRRENTGEQVGIGFDLDFHWLKKVVPVFPGQSQSKAMQNQGKRNLLPTHLKTVLSPTATFPRTAIALVSLCPNWVPCFVVCNHVMGTTLSTEKSPG